MIHKISSSFINVILFLIFTIYLPEGETFQWVIKISCSVFCLQTGPRILQHCSSLFSAISGSPFIALSLSCGHHQSKCLHTDRLTLLRLSFLQFFFQALTVHSEFPWSMLCMIEFPWSMWLIRFICFLSTVSSSLPSSCTKHSICILQIWEGNLIVFISQMFGSLKGCQEVWFRWTARHF